MDADGVVSFEFPPQVSRRGSCGRLRGGRQGSEVRITNQGAEGLRCGQRRGVRDPCPATIFQKPVGPERDAEIEALPGSASDVDSDMDAVPSGRRSADVGHGRRPSPRASHGSGTCARTDNARLLTRRSAAASGSFELGQRVLFRSAGSQTAVPPLQRRCRRAFSLGSAAWPCLLNVAVQAAGISPKTADSAMRWSGRPTRNRAKSDFALWRYPRLGRRPVECPSAGDCVAALVIERPPDESTIVASDRVSRSEASAGRRVRHVVILAPKALVRAVLRRRADHHSSNTLQRVRVFLFVAV